MTTHWAAAKRETRPWRASDAADWIGLAASPSFAMMAWIATTDTSRLTLCASASAMPIMDGMAWMYLLMSLFHVPAWLRLIVNYPRQQSHN